MEPNFPRDNFPRDYRAYGMRTHSGLVPGLILVAVGALFFLNNLHIIYVREWLPFWPVILIALGIVKLVDSNFMGGRVAGAVLVGAGAIFLAQTMGFLDVRIHDLWPLFLIGFGVLLLFKRTGQWHSHRLRHRHRHLFSSTYNPAGQPDDQPVNPNTVKIDALFSGGKRIVTTQDFQGGEIASIFGGVELDLRQAGMAGDSAILEINAIFGGVEIKIPQAWSAVVHGVGIFGGFSDSTLQPNTQVPGTKKLIVKGEAVFGGVDVKN